ncbi:MAG: hypothetical protein WBL50_24265 [Candidatus Acidiferrum sp.]|jgi:hypothetical protein
MRILIAATIMAMALLGMTQLFTTSVISVLARTFCMVAVLVFAGVALFGLATKLRA